MTKNREAGLGVTNPDIAQYFRPIFETDWPTAFTTPDKTFTCPSAAPEPLTTEALGAGGFIKVERGDYQQV